MRLVLSITPPTITRPTVMPPTVMPPTVSQPPRTRPPGNPLPPTGSSAGLLLTAGVLMLALGGLLVMLTRRRRPRPDAAPQ